MANTITMYLKYQNNDLYYSMDNVNFSPLEEDTITGVNTGDTVKWELAENSGIDKINGINVNETKSGRKSVDIWETKPKNTDSSHNTYSGLIKSGLDNSEKFNGYTIKYKTSDGDKEKDPGITQPPSN
ncbi:MAG: hypothetical protein R3345_11615 [Fulvivirga sp.]|nr:hypothetical protein [Fulvivirga sp.]